MTRAKTDTGYNVTVTVTVTEAAKQAGVQKETIRRHIQDRNLDAELVGGRIYMIRQADLDAWIAKRNKEEGK